MKTLQTHVGDVVVIITSPPTPEYPAWSWLTGTANDVLLSDGWAPDAHDAIGASLVAAHVDSGHGSVAEAEQDRIIARLAHY